jgi:hypothetical protein
MADEVKALTEYQTREERIAVVRRLMVDERHTNASAAKALNTTKGTIAGIRFRYHIPSTHEVRVFPKKKHKPLRFAVSEAVQCVEIVEVGGTKTHCGYEREPYSLYCRLHARR